MNFSISGLKATEHGTISMPLSNVFVEPNTGVKVMVHVPAVSNAAGAANPQVQTNELQRSVGIATYYPITEKVMKRTAEGALDDTNFQFCITDFKNRDFAEINVTTDALQRGLDVRWNNDKWDHTHNGQTKEAEVFLLRPQMTCLMVSILAERGEVKNSITNFTPFYRKVPL